MKRRPAALTELIEWPQWVGYSHNKVPIDPNTGSAAKSTDASTWGTFEDACRARRDLGLAGVGFVFTEDDPFVGVDLDNAFAADGVLEPWADKLVQEFASYTEVSPSGRGLHIICRGDNVPGRKRPCGGGAIEVYAHARYFTVTGDMLPGTPEGIRDGNGALIQLLDWMGKPKQTPAVDVPEVTYEAHEPASWVEDAIDYIGADDYYTWIRVGMALRSELGDAAFDMWCRWSSRSMKYEGQAKTYQKWQTFDGDGVGLGTVVWLAEQNGWEMPEEYRGGHRLDEQWVAEVDEMVSGDAHESRPRIEFHDFGVAYQDDSPLPPDLIGPGVLGAGDLMLVAGPPKSMKSMLLLDMLRAWCTGVEWHDMKPTEPLRAAMIQFEVKADKMRERIQLADLPREQVEFLKGRLIYTDRFTPQMGPELASDLRDGIEHHMGAKPDILVFDPLANIFTGDNENDNAQMSAFLKQIKTIRAHINPKAAIILVHHAGKASKSERESEPFNAIRGAGALRGAYDTGIYVEKTDRGLKMWRELRNGPGLGRLELAFEEGQFVNLSPHLVSEITNAVLDDAEVSALHTMSAFIRAKADGLGVGEKVLQAAVYDMLEEGLLAFWTGDDTHKPHPQSNGFLVVPGMLLAGKPVGV